MISSGTLLIFFIFNIVNKLHHLCSQCCKDGDLRVLSAASLPKAFISRCLFLGKTDRAKTEIEDENYMYHLVKNPVKIKTGSL